MTCDAPFPNLCCNSADECTVLTDPDYLVVRELIRELMVRDEPTFHNARVLNFFKKLDAAGYAISRKRPAIAEGLYSVCKPCDVFQPLDQERRFGDFGLCKNCGQKMDLWTGGALRRALTEGQ